MLFETYPKVDEAPPKVPNEKPVLAGSVVPENPVFAESDDPKLNSFFSDDPKENAGAVVAVDPFPNLKLVSAGLELVPKPVETVDNAGDATVGVVVAAADVDCSMLYLDFKSARCLS